MRVVCPSCSQRLQLPDQCFCDEITCPSCVATFKPGTDRYSISSCSLFEEMGDYEAIRDLLRHPKEKYLAGSDKRIGQGGMGEIHEVEDLNISRKVAKKTLKHSSSKSVEDAIRLIEEAQLTGQLEHPSIIPVYDLGTDESDQVYYTMKRVNGSTLQEILDSIRNGDSAASQHTLGSMLAILQKVCDALSYAHSQSVIHRDIKPQNIMVGEFGEVLLMDWGLAKSLGGQSSKNDPMSRSPVSSLRTQELFGTDTHEGTVFGSPFYISPEQAEGNALEVDYRSDIYSIGAILYEILTLQPPIEGASLDETLSKVRRGDIEHPNFLYRSSRKDEFSHCPNGKIPEALAAVAMKALQLKKENRYQRVEELQSDLDSYLGGFATTAQNPTTITNMLLFLQRHRGILCFFGLIILMSIGLCISIAANQLNQVAHAEEIISISREMAPRFVEEAKVALEKGDLEKSKTSLLVAQKLDPFLWSVWYQKGRLELGQHLFSDAYTSFQKADQLNKDNANQEVLRQLKTLSEKWKLQADAGLYQQSASFSAQLGRDLYAVDPVLAGRAFEMIEDSRAASYLSAQYCIDEILRLNTELRLKKDSVVRFERADSGIDGLFFSDTELFQNPEELKNIKPINLAPWDKIHLEHVKLKNLEPFGRIPGLKELRVRGKDIHTLEPIRNIRLKTLSLGWTPVTDLSPLKDMPLENLSLINPEISDISSLAGLPLRSLSLSRSYKLNDIEALKGMPLQSVHLGGGMLRDFSPILAAPIDSFNIDLCAPGVDFSFLGELPLRQFLRLSSMHKVDLSFLSGKEMETLFLSMPIRDLGFLEQCKCRSLFVASDILEDISGLASQRDLHTVVIQSRGFVVRDISVPDLSSFRSLKNLKSVSLRDFIEIDLSEFEGLTQLRSMKISAANSFDLSAIANVELEELHLSCKKEIDLTPLKGMSSLRVLNLENCSEFKGGLSEILATLNSLENYIPPLLSK